MSAAVLYQKFHLHTFTFTLTQFSFINTRWSAVFWGSRGMTRQRSPIWRPFGDEPKAPRDTLLVLQPSFRPVSRESSRRRTDLLTDSFAGGGHGLEPSLAFIHPHNDSFTGVQSWFPISRPGSPRESPRSARLTPLFDAIGEERARTAAGMRVASYRKQHEPLRQPFPERQPALPLHQLVARGQMYKGKLGQRTNHVGRPLPFVPMLDRAVY